MQLQDRKIGSVLVVTPLIKRMDTSVAAEFKHRMLAWIEAGEQRILLDLSAVDFLDSSGLGAIISAHKAIRNQGRLAVCGLTRNVRNLFNMTRMNRILPLFEDVDQAAKDLAT